MSCERFPTFPHLLPGKDTFERPLGPIDVLTHGARGIVVVHHAHRLHHRVHRRRPNEGPSTSLQILGQTLGFITRGSKSRGRRCRFVTRSVGPDMDTQRAHLLHESCAGPSIGHHCRDLSAMTNDRRIADDPIDVVGREPHEFGDLEIREHLSKPVPSCEDDGPRQSTLESFQTDLFEQASIICSRNAPFAIVVHLHLRR